MLEIGYHDVPAGHTVSVVTHLEMNSQPVLRAQADLPLKLERVMAPKLGWYRDVFQQVGADYLWFGRLSQSDDELGQVLHDPGVHIYALKDSEADVGLLELDFRTDHDCELAYFGIIGSHVGGGAGRWLMDQAITLAWQQPITRFHVHTCSLDHPNALDFYIRSGFTPYKRQVEVARDPRLIGLLPNMAAPHFPTI